ncbi:MAG: glycerol kinase GlpK [Solirubrobacteraceae bacterium]
MILSIDHGTSSTTCVVYDERGEVLARAQGELAQRFPSPGWVEHDPREIAQLVVALAARALEQAAPRPGELLAVGIANQRETVCAWDPRSGEPLCNAIVWQDRRTAATCARMREDGLEPLVRERTGLLLDPYFSATKIAWLLEHVDGLRERASAGRAVFGTVDSWLLHTLTGEHLTDVTNASRTLLYDISRRRWDTELLELFRIPGRALPEVRDSACSFGTIRAGLPGAGTPVCGVAGDQQAALFGQCCVAPGMAKATYGTGSFVLLNAGHVMPAPADGVLSTLAASVGPRGAYAIEASIFVTGAAVQWLRDGLGVISTAQETETLARSLRGNDGVYFVPALTGLGSPHWDADARGTIVGLTRGCTRAHLARAALEAIAYQTLDAVAVMEQAAGEPLRELRADGGASTNRWLMQFQADVLGVPVLVPEASETTAFGAALLAGVGASLWTVEDTLRFWRQRARYEPSMQPAARERLLAGWRAAVARTLSGGARRGGR